MFGTEITLEIDNTLDQLIRNAELIQMADFDQLSETEIDAFQKTQESLLHHFIHMDQKLVAQRNNLRKQNKDSTKSKIQEKWLRFEKLKNEYNKNLSEQIRSWHRQSLLSKRRTKRLIYCV